MLGGAAGTARGASPSGRLRRGVAVHGFDALQPAHQRPVVHDARDVVGELPVLRTVEIGFHLGAGSHGQFSLELEGIGRIPQLGTQLETGGND